MGPHGVHVGWCWWRRVGWWELTINLSLSIKRVTLATTSSYGSDANLTFLHLGGCKKCRQFYPATKNGMVLKTRICVLESKLPVPTLYMHNQNLFSVGGSSTSFIRIGCYIHLTNWQSDLWSPWPKFLYVRAGLRDFTSPQPFFK